MDFFQTIKRNHFRLCGVFTAFLAISPFAHANDYEFTLGAQAGYSSSRSQFTDSSSSARTLTEYPINGPILGLYASANVLMNNWNLGIEVDYTGREQSSKSFTDDLLSNISESKTLSFKNRQDISLLLGYQFTQQIRFYLRGGWSTANYHFSSYDSDDGTSQFDLKLNAPHYGFGIRINLTEHFSLRTDYRFATFSGDRVAGATTTDYKFETHSFLAGIGYTF